MLVNGFRYYFTPLTGGLFTFPSRYLFTIGQFEYLVLEHDRPSFPQGFPCPVVLGNLARILFNLTYGAITLYGFASQRTLLSKNNSILQVPQPLVRRLGLDCSAFARRYSRNHYCFIFLRLLRCVSSPGCLSD